MPLLQKRVKPMEIVVHNDREYAISSCITDQRERRSIEHDENGKRKKGKLLGYEKPEITVYRIHCSKILTNSDKYIGEDYEPIS